MGEWDTVSLVTQPPASESGTPQVFRTGHSKGRSKLALKRWVGGGTKAFKVQRVHRRGAEPLPSGALSQAPSAPQTVMGICFPLLIMCPPSLVAQTGGPWGGFQKCKRMHLLLISKC